MIRNEALDGTSKADDALHAMSEVSGKSLCSFEPD
jgi:hypothetical protein